MATLGSCNFKLYIVITFFLRLHIIVHKKINYNKLLNFLCKTK